MKYAECMEYVEECQGFGSVPGLENTRRLLERLGNPERLLRFVHIAGTNGKGSVLSMISTVLAEAGYKTGRYISPTISDYRERFQINGKMISKPELGAYMERIRDAAEEIAAEGNPHPTIFEMETALGFLWFAEKSCDIVVLETGMGGLLDATNVIPAPLLCVLASISRDHMGVLGETLSQIAEQKAGIIKPGSRVVSIVQEPEAMRVVEEACRKQDCALSVADPAQACRVRYGLERQRLSYGGCQNLEITLAGKYQIDNCVLAVEALKALSGLGFPVTEEKLRSGLLKASWPGRFQVIGKKPLFVVDGAHNEDGAKRLAQSIDFYFTNKRILYIIGILKDKEADRILEQTCPYADAVICAAAPGNPRAMAALDLAQEARKYHSNVTAADSLEEAVEMARLLAGPQDVILAFGSLSFQGELMRIVKNVTVHSGNRTAGSDNHGR